MLDVNYLFTIILSLCLSLLVSFCPLCVSVVTFGVRTKTHVWAEFHISLAIAQLWQVGDTYRVACLVLKKGLQYILK